MSFHDATCRTEQAVYPINRGRILDNHKTPIPQMVTRKMTQTNKRAAIGRMIRVVKQIIPGRTPRTIKQVAGRTTLLGTTTTPPKTTPTTRTLAGEIQVKRLVVPLVVRVLIHIWQNPGLIVDRKLVRMLADPCPLPNKHPMLLSNHLKVPKKRTSLLSNLSRVHMLGLHPVLQRRHDSTSLDRYHSAASRTCPDGNRRFQNPSSHRL